MNIPRYIRSLCGAVMLAACAFAAQPADAQVAVTINGNGIYLSPPPIIEAGRVFVPLRGIFEQLGASVVYAGGTINATGNGRTISLQIGSTQATIDGQPTTIDVAPFIVGASTFVPLRFVSEALGASVNWDESSRQVSIDMAGAPQQQQDQYAPPAVDDQDDYNYTDTPPPPIPVYEQPYVPAPNYVWQPGYWAWGPYGYYWVPGTWVQAPQPGYLWTPGYWGFSNGGFGWHAGYWAIAVGFYGGVNYGAGYYGNGYSGGRWSGNQFRYNTYVTRVNVTIVHNVYVDRTVYVNNSTTRISYNGGPRGIQARPTGQQLQVARLHHLGLTPAQIQHVRTAGQDRGLLATVNHGRPQILALPKPLTVTTRPAGFVPVRPADRIPVRPGPAVRPIPEVRTPAVRPMPEVRTPAVRPMPEVRTPAVRPMPEVRTPAVRPMPEYRTPAVRPMPEYHTPAVRPMPEYHTPAVRPMPEYHTPAVRPAPEYHAPPVHTAPVYHPPAPAYHAPPAAPAYHAPPKPPAAAAPAAPHPKPHPAKTLPP